MLTILSLNLNQSETPYELYNSFILDSGLIKHFCNNPNCFSTTHSVSKNDYITVKNTVILIKVWVIIEIHVKMIVDSKIQWQTVTLGEVGLVSSLHTSIILM